MDHLVLYYAPLGPSVPLFFAVFFGTTWTQPYFCFTTCLNILRYIFCLVSFVILFSLFLLQMLEQLPVGRLAKLWLSAFNSRANNTVLNYCQSFCKFKAWCLHSTGEVSFLSAASITVSLHLHHLLDNSSGGFTIHSVFYAINWVHKLAGFENRNPCEGFFC